MPLSCREITLAELTDQRHGRLLRDDPAQAAALRAPAPAADVRLFEGEFNQRPVALLRARRDADGWLLISIVVHPATRQRGVARELLRQAGALLAPAPLRLPLAVCRT